MEFWPEFLASSSGREFIAGGFGGMAGVISGHPLDTLRIRLQQPSSSSSFSALKVLRSMASSEGPLALYKGMSAPLASVAFQNAVVFQVYAVLSRAFDSRNGRDPPSYKSVVLGGVGTGALQSLILCPVELIKIQLQLQKQASRGLGPMGLIRRIMEREGVKGMYRGLAVTALRDAPAHGVYFWTYEYTREHLHPGCRQCEENTTTTLTLGKMLVAGGVAGVASWVCCYPLDVLKSRLQGEPAAYTGILHCFRKSVREEGPAVLWRGLGTAVARAFVVNGAIFSAYEVALRCLSSYQGGQSPSPAAE
ncbi:mitochondrial arginine transporter BAC2 [Amborella trichopoda]|nr:mitochondrial arginine transporter BAC2 [Amborella trichopoda]|eukprot:XP_006837919.2 mitochondrial arginine transporter BAC2 [Amborella trichopoda]